MSSDDLSVVCYWYKGKVNYTAHHVNTLRHMFVRRLKRPHKFFVVGDQSDGLYRDIEFVSCNRELIPLGGNMVRLDLWRRDAASIFSKRILAVDLDVVLVNDIDPLVDRSEDVVIWRDKLADRHNGFLYNSSLILLKAGSHPEVWENFHPDLSPRIMRKEEWAGKGKLGGSDQSWISRILGPNIPTFGPDDGVLSYKFDEVVSNGLTNDTRLVIFHGIPKPWDCSEDWIKQNYW